MGLFSGMATKMMCKTVEKTIPTASTEKLEQHFHTISQLLQNSNNPDNDFRLVELRMKITQEFDRRGHIPSMF